MTKRGGYAGNLKLQVKVRVSADTYEKLQQLSEEQEKTVARTIREFIRTGLEAKKERH